MVNDLLFVTAGEAILLTANLIDILEGQTKGLACWSFRGDDAVQCIEKSLSRSSTFLSFNLPFFEPTNLQDNMMSPQRSRKNKHNVQYVNNNF